MKPVETGAIKKNGALVPADAVRLKDAAGSSDPLELINPYRFARPVAPSIAARLKEVRIDFRKIKRCYLELKKRHEISLVEGAGGILTPLTGKKTIADLIAYLKIPAIIIVPQRLGAINQALMAVEAAKAKGVKVRGIILNSLDGKNCRGLKYNKAEIERLSKTAVLGIVHYEKNKAALFKEGGPLSKILKRVTCLP